MKTKYLAIIFIVLLFITLASAFTAYLIAIRIGLAASSTSVPAASSKEQGESGIENNLNSTVEKRAAPAVEQPVAAAKIDRAVEQIRTSLIVDGKKYEITVPVNSSVYDLMQALKNQKKIDFSGKDYAGLGFFVQEINGQRNDAGGKNWIYYVNGREAPVGVSSYKVKNGDVIEWRYEKYNANMSE